jgi:hypothetical protein
VIGDGNENPTTNKDVVEVEINGDLDITEHNEVESLTVTSVLWQCTRKTRIAPSTNIRSMDNPSVTTMKPKAGQHSKDATDSVEAEPSQEDQFDPKTTKMSIKEKNNTSPLHLHEWHSAAMPRDSK